MFPTVMPRVISSARSRSISCSVASRKRIVGLHAQHEVHAALQVEPELELPGRSGSAGDWMS